MLDDAVQHFEDALEIDSEFALAYAGLGEAYWRKFVITQNVELVDQAKKALIQAQTIDENLPPVQFLMGLIENGQNNFEEAIQYFENALNLNPEYTRAHRQMASAYYNLGDKEEALKIYERLIEGQPEYWIGYRDLALYHYDETNWDQAIDNFKKAIDLTSQNSSLYSNLGAAYFQNSEVDSARVMFERSMAIEENPLSAVNLATIYYRNGNYNEAADMYELVLENELFRNRYEIWANYASAVEWSESIDGEKELYETAIEKAKEQLDVNPDDVVVLSSIAVFHSDLNNREQALEYLNKAIDLDSENQVLIVNAISTYENLGMRQEALSWVRADIISQIEWLPDLQAMIEDPEYIDLKEELLKEGS
jgi:tetratricopeptide (TPR) repeat protein